MSLIATEPVRPATQDTINDGDAKVTSHAFWPVIVLSALRRAMRLDGQVTTDRLMDKAIEAVAHVNGQLADWRNTQEQRGFAVLPEVKPDSTDEIDQINGESVLVWRYRRAVYSITKALLIEGSYAPRKKKLRRTQLGIRFLWNGEARTLSNWRSSKTSSGRMITGFDVDKGAVRSFNRDDIERYLEINRSEKRQTVKRDYPMFRKLRTAQFLYAKAYPNAAIVEFKGKAADIARQHQYGLMGTVSALTKVRYPQRELLGVSPSEKVKLLNLVYHDLMDELRK
ncbi:head completion/stabilization protein [Pectobacterium carotovorum]|uniref:head completion/stabilization protein n=1 Tax=Pectobacterium carotovorum TaxID=554 RepID=UPI001EED4C8A|nr:head completion/stabilization protein [Pectobacterium carotovorum]